MFILSQDKKKKENKEMSEKNDRKNKAGWINAMLAVLFILALVTIFQKWNEIWYDFGRNLYHFFNS